MRNRFNSSEPEKNRIRKLHKNNSVVINEQQSTPMGIQFQSCDPNTTPMPIDYPITLDGQPLTNGDVGTEISFPTNPGFNGKIDGIFPASNPNGTPINAISTPCPPPVMPPLGIVFGSCDPNTSPIQIPMPITINGVPVTQNDVGKEIEVNSGQANAQNGKIDSLLVATQNLSNSVDVIESPCPPPTMPSMGIELKLCGQPNTSPMSIDAAVTIDGQPVTQGDVGKEVSGGGPNTHGTVDSVFISMNPNQAAPFISKPCKPIIEPVDPCKEFSMLDRVEQRDICKKCKTDRRNPMCKCCEKFRP